LAAAISVLPNQPASDNATSAAGRTTPSARENKRGAITTVQIPNATKTKFSCHFLPEIERRSRQKTQ